jgi:hypothetical protein
MDSNITNKKEVKPFSPASYCIHLFVSIAILSFVFLAIMPHYPPIRPGRVKNNCFSEIRVLSGAVELYNLDYETKIHNLDDDTIKSLVDNQYLKKLPKPYIEKCKYISQGDLASDSGVIFCEAHGDIDGNIKGKYSEDDIARDIYTKERDNKFTAFSIAFSIIFLISFSAVTFSQVIYPRLKDTHKTIFFITLVIIIIILIKYLYFE